MKFEVAIDLSNKKYCFFSEDIPIVRSFRNFIEFIRKLKKDIKTYKNSEADDFTEKALKVLKGQNIAFAHIHSWQKYYGFFVVGVGEGAISPRFNSLDRLLKELALLLKGYSYSNFLE